MRSIVYRPEIDGLRAIAVLGVIIFHLSPRILPSGFMGVDIFFVISGYLITSIILREKARGIFRLGSFWARRVRRILPALSAMIILSLVAALVVGLPWLVNDGGKQAVSASACVSNYRMLTLVSSYWSAHADRLLLLHTWSLAVEEQFYLFYPLLLVMGLAALGQGFIRPTLWVVAALSMAWCYWQTSDAPAHAFFLMPARAWELLAGALIAAHEPFLARMGGASRRAGVWIGAMLILCSMLLPENWASFPWPLALFPVVGSAAFIACSDAESTPGRWFSHGAIVGVGKASYSLYLWHWPSLVVGGLLASAAELPYLREGFLLAGIGLGILSYRWIEPLGRQEAYVRRFAPLSFACMAGAAFFCAYKTPFYGPGEYLPEKWMGEPYDARLLPKIGGAALGVPIRGSNRADVILLGDSHALSLAPAVDSCLRRRQMSGLVFASGGAGLVQSDKPYRYDMKPDERRVFEEARDDALIMHQPRMIWISARWEVAAKKEGLGALKEYISHLKAVCPSATIVILGQPPRLNQGSIKLNEWLNLRRRIGIEGCDIPLGADLLPFEYAFAENFLRKLPGADPRLIYIDAKAVFPISGNRVSTIHEGRLLYVDDNHLALAGAELVVEHTLARLKK